MLKMTGVRLKKIVDIDMYLFIEKWLRGGISLIARATAKPIINTWKFMTIKTSKFITYLDMNNLYGWAMSSYLPYGGFTWWKNVDGCDVNSISEKRPIGYVLEVDLEYPDELHLLHSDYPLAPEKLAVPYDMLSDCYKKIADKYGRKVVVW